MPVYRNVACSMAFCVSASNASFAQSFEGFQPEYAPGKHAEFDRPRQELDLGDVPSFEEPVGPSIEIAGTRVAPDFKHRGLRVTIPMDLVFQTDKSVEDDPDPNAF